MNTGGIGSYMFHLAHLLSNAGHRVTVFSATTQGAEVQQELHPYCINYLFPATDPADFRERVRIFFSTYIQQYRVDIIESPEVGACALGIKQDYPSIPLIVRLHTPGVLITRVSNTYQPVLTKLRFVAGALRRGKFDLGYWSCTDKNRYRDPEYRICMLAERLVSPSEALKKFLQGFWCLDKEIEVIPNPFHADADLFDYPIAGREKIICFVGKLTVLKGMFAFTQAVKQLLIQHPDYLMVFAGRDEAVSSSIPSMRAWMEEWLSEVKERVEFTGALQRTEVKHLLGRSRVCVVPSLWENYPTIVLEAMAAGTAVAAAHRGGIPEIVKPGITGSLFNPLRADQINKTVSQLLADDNAREVMSIAARKWVQRSQKTTVDLILRLYESTIVTKT